MIWERVYPNLVTSKFCKMLVPIWQHKRRHTTEHCNISCDTEMSAEQIGPEHVFCTCKFAKTSARASLLSYPYSLLCNSRKESCKRERSGSWAYCRSLYSHRHFIRFLANPRALPQPKPISIAPQSLRSAKQLNWPATLSNTQGWPHHANFLKISFQLSLLSTHPILSRTS